MRNFIPSTTAPPLVRMYLNLTNKCNYKCAYCYQGQEPTDQFGFFDLNQLHKVISVVKSINPTCEVIITGGEPFLHPNILGFFYLLEKEEMPFSILTNGSLINGNIASALATMRYLVNVQISLDGSTREIHNLTRGKTFNKTMQGIKTIIRHGIPFSLAPTIHKGNATDLSNIARYAVRHNGSFTPNYLRKFPHCPSPQLTLSNKDLLKALLQVDKDVAGLLGNGHILHNQRGRVHHRDHFVCGAGRSVLDIDWNGDIYPCHLLRQAHFKLGNIFNTSFDDILLKVEKLKIRTETHKIPTCKKCHFMSLCGGGCRAAAYYSSGTFDREDPFCSLFYENELYRLQRTHSAFITT